MFISCVQAELSRHENVEINVKEQVKPSANVVPGMVNILIDDKTAERIDWGEDPYKLFISLNPIHIQRLFPRDSVFETRQREAGLHKWYTVVYDIATPRTKVTDVASNVDGVVAVEEIIRAETDAFPFNDAYAINKQWHLQNTGNLYNGFRSGADINVVPVWNDFTAGSSDVIVGIIDSGIQYNHPDLAGVVIPPGENGSKSFFVSNILSPYHYSTIDNHGTHVAGIIAAINNNGIGISGIAGGKDGTGGIRIMDCQAIGQSSYIESAFTWAANHGAIILNNSWNSVYDSESIVPSTTPSSYASAIDYFIKNAGTGPDGSQTGPMKGGVVFFSAGNNSWTKSQPAMYEKVIAVGATGPAGEAAAYTNYGPWVDICAPGGNHNSYSNEIAQIFSTKTGDSYGALQGTSMACPMVSGVAALLVSYFGGPGFTNEDLKEMLFNGANYESMMNRNRNIGPSVDAYGSFTVNSRVFLPVENFYSVPNKRSATIVVTVQAYGDEPVYAYSIAISTDEKKLKDFNPFNVPDGVTVKTIVSANAKIGARLSTSFNNLAAGKYYCTAIAYSKSHQYSKDNAIIDFEITGNRAPVINPSYVEPFTLLHNQKDTLNVSFSDPDGDRMNFVVGRSTVAAKWLKVTDNSLKLVLDGSADDPGVYSATLTVSDIEGLSSELQIPFSIESNFPPVIYYQYDGKAYLTHNDSVSVLFEYTDPDDDNLEVLTDGGSSAANWILGTDDSIRLQINGDLGPSGTYTASLIVKDPSGLYATASFTYTILPNSAPEISSSVQSGISLSYGQSASVDFTISDFENDTVSVQAIPGSSYAVWERISDTHYVLRISGDSLEEGRYEASLTATDNHGGETSTHFAYILKGNKQPLVTSVPSDILIKDGERREIRLGQFFNDPDGDPLQYSVSSDSDNSNLSVTGDILIIQAGDAPGIAEVSITATDGFYSPVSSSFLVRTYIDSTADVFPTRVSDKLTIMAAVQGNARIRIFTSTGRIVLTQNVTLSPFKPHEIDMGSCAPGVYTISITEGNISKKYRIVKI